ncbi:glycoside hydrolase family 88/105 protein [Desmospora activa]|uniref:Unsaturated rhamnogalacturonyl hydrolase n=1 Tax=Desmospora activa DSM 45169 TaxID=1121389 RepID=A0A2T4Z3Y6_9BACL|nr:glycoside hydrolase family 88 protein [Desmospora activa]PTM56576.1 unsaturated rhamnogalacturonyl hydrolase [Desmospora activa DSM 45169]
MSLVIGETKTFAWEWSQETAKDYMRKYPYLHQDPHADERWHYERGCMLKAIADVWANTGDQQYFDYIQRNMDTFIQDDGTIRSYYLEEYNLDQINTGKLLFPLYQKTGQEKYKQALDLLFTQLKGQPRTSEDGFWHKKVYPYQMWLDGLYMASPFLAEYAKTFDIPAGLDDAARQILLVESKTRDPITGLLYHGWDESGEQKWAHHETGCSPHFWSRAMGWYAMAIVDVLDHLPRDHEKRGQIIGIFERMMQSLRYVQDDATGLWYQVLDRDGWKGNYLEASGSSMFVYAYAKGLRQKYLSSNLRETAEKGFHGLLQHCVEVDEQEATHLHRGNGGAGLGGNPYRDGSYEYYVNEPTRQNDPKTVSAFIMACIEMERLKVKTEGLS